MQETSGWLSSDSSIWDTIGTAGVAIVAIALAIAAALRARAVIAESKSDRHKGGAPGRTAQSTNVFADKETFPNLLIGAATTREKIVKENTMAILNMGGGTARDLRLRCHEESSSYDVPLGKQVLVIRDILEVPFAGSPGTLIRFQLTFRTDFGTQYALDFEWNAKDSRAVNEKLTVIS
jgi:hypothetical protein